MQQPTAEQIAQFEMSGAAPLAIPEAGEGFVAWVRPFTYPEFAELINVGFRGGDEGTNARSMAMFRAVVYPSRAEVNKAHSDFPATRGRIIDAVERFAGKLPERWFRFDSTVDAEILAELRIPAETAALLRASYPLRGQLWICHVPDLDVVIVVRRPTASIAERMIEKASKARFDAAVEATIDCAVWARDRETVGSGELVGTILRELPALASNIILPKLLDTITGEASAEKKGFVPRGRRSAAT